MTTATSPGGGGSGGATATPTPDAGPLERTLGRADDVGCADPGLDYDAGVYYLVCTAKNDRYYTSVDLVHWTAHGMTIAFPSWVDAKSGVWAYELEKVGSRWYLYFAAPDLGNPASKGHHRSIGVVEAPAMTDGMTWTAPKSLAGAPLVAKQGASLIDPFTFADDDGTLYIYYNEFTSTKADSGVYVNRLSDPVTKACCQKPLLGAHTAATPKPPAAAWTGGTLEAPAVFKRGGAYYLMFSGNAYMGAKYAVGMARSTSPTGPFVEAPSDPALDCDRMTDTFGGGCLMGPGGASVAPDGALVFHARMAGDPGRMLYYGGLELGASGWPVIR